MELFAGRCSFRHAALGSIYDFEIISGEFFSPAIKNRSYRGTVRILQLKRQKRIEPVALFDFIQVAKILHSLTVFQEVIGRIDVSPRVRAHFQQIDVAVIILMGQPRAD
jgi:hypothetical protein